MEEVYVVAVEVDGSMILSGDEPLTMSGHESSDFGHVVIKYMIAGLISRTLGYDYGVERRANLAGCTVG